MHAESHPMAGRAVTLNPGTQDPQRGVVVGGTVFEVEDWYDYAQGRGGGLSWQEDQTFTTAWYGARRESLGLPLDDEVVYGHIRGLGHIVHTSEINVAYLEVDNEGSFSLHTPDGVIDVPPAARVTEEVSDTEVFEVVFHGAMRHAFQAWVDEHPDVMVVHTPREMRRDGEEATPGYHEYLVVPSLLGLGRAADRKTSVDQLDL